MHELCRKQVMVIPEDENMMELIEDVTSNRDIVDDLNRKKISKLIEESLMKKDDKIKIVGILCYYEDLTTKEIAVIMDISEGTVKSLDRLQ